MKYLPKRYRPKKDISSLVGNIHSSARLAAELQDAFKDDEGDGDVIKSAEDLAAEAKAAADIAKKEKKLLKERMKNRNFKGSNLTATAAEEEDDEEKDANLDKMFGAVEEAKPKGVSTGRVWV